MRCLSLEELERHLEGGLDDDRRAAVDDHLSHCATCRESRDDLVANLAISDAVRGALRGRGSSPDPAEVRDQVGSFRIVRELGRGGMGIVYLAEQERPRRPVALKMLRPDASAELVRRFEHEANLLARLRHPGIAQVYEVGTVEGRPYLAMEYIEGERLDRWVASRPLRPRDRLRLLAEVCDAVHHAHVNGVVHRDLKPGNILVVPDADDVGRPRVLDFGVARATDADLQSITVKTEVGQLLGTVPFMSPEQVTGDPTRVDARSDVYSLGVLGHWLLTARLPYDLSNRSIVEIARVICEVEPISIATLDARWRGEVETILTCALTKDPDRRYQSASELAGDIRRFLTNQPIVARGPSTAYAFRKLVRRHRTAFVLAAVSVVLLLVYGVTMSVLFQRARTAEHTAQQESEAAEEVATFLEELFQAPNPWQSPGPDVTAREIFAQGAERIRANPPRDPEVHARLLRVLGTTQLRLGDAEGGGELLREAYALRRRATVLSDEFAMSTRDLATLASMEGDYGRADSMAREAIDLFHRLPDATPAHLASAYTGRARIRMAMGGLDDADSLLAEALERLDISPSGESPPLDAGSVTLEEQRNHALQLLGSLRVQQGRLDEAERVHRHLLARRRAIHGDRHLWVAVSLNNLGTVLDEQGDPEAAVALMSEALDIAREHLGPDQADVAKLVSNVGAMHYRLGDLDGAEPHFREALDIQRRKLGDHHPDVAWRLHNLGALLVAKGEPAEAIPFLEKAIAIRAELLPADHWTTAESRGVLGTCYTALQRFAEAEPLLLESYPVIRAGRGEDDRLTTRARQRIVDLYEAWGRPEQADAHRSTDEGR